MHPPRLLYRQLKTDHSLACIVDCETIQRETEEYHDQARLRQRQALQVRQLPASRLLQIVQLGPGRCDQLQLLRHASRFDSPCLIRRLSRSRCPYGDYAGRCRGHGRGIAARGWRLALPTTSDERASDCGGHYEVGAHHRAAEQD